MATGPLSTPTSDIGTPDVYYGQVLPDYWENTVDLMWPESSITYSRMRHDPQLKAVLNAYILPILHATWVLDPAGCRDQVVQLVADDLGVSILGADTPGPARRRGIIWQRHIRQAVHGQLVFGFMPFERRYDVTSAMPGGTHLAALGSRMPWTISRVNTNRDGSVASVLQNSQMQPIPSNRLAWYVNDLEGANWTGISMLRACFGAWILKHETWRVHATSIRRFGMGVPGVKAPPGATNAQISQAQRMASSMRAGDTAGMAVPAGFEPFIMGMTGSAPDALAFIEYLDRVMAKQALAALIELGQTETGSRALGETFMDLFMLSVQGVADEVAVTATSGHDGMPGIVTDLVDQNWGEDEPAPRLVCTDVGTNYEASAAAIQQLVVSGALQPDPALDEWTRRQWHLPERTTPWVAPAPKPAAPSPSAPSAAPPAAGAEPAAGEPVAAARESGSPRAAGSVLRRQRTAFEAAAGFNPEQHQSDWQRALDNLLSTFRQITAGMKTDLVEQVAACLTAGDVGQLAQLTVDTEAGAQALMAAMQAAWSVARDAMVAEAASQGVAIDAASVAMPDMQAIASGRVQFAATFLAQQAGSRAMRSVQPTKPAKKQAENAALDLGGFLDDLSTRALKDQLGGALTAAQNAGRVAVLQAAPASAGTAKYMASEILDVNTCEKCRDEDGHEFDTLAAAQDTYPTGGYIDCQAELRCRGTVVALWGDTSGQ